MLLITGDITPTVEGLHITGGDAAGLGGASWGRDAGGGVYVVTATATFSSNHVFSNTAEHYGGGLYLLGAAATLINNAITSNAAFWSGGGLYLDYSPAALSGNTISANTAGDYGGGLYLLGAAATLSGNTITDNAADRGGGLYLYRSDATLSSNTISANTADAGGGLYLYRDNSTLTNNVIADNQAGTAGSGLYVENSAPHLLHTTIVRNSGGDGSGIYVTGYSWYYDPSTVVLINAVLVSHSVGVSVTEGNTVTINGVLWHNTPITVSQPVTAFVTVQNQHTGDPAFVDPDAGDYHIDPGSAAIDAGVDAGVDHDLDSDPRPAAFGFDIGADERPGASLHVHKVVWPLSLNNGHTLTYTLVVTSAGVDTTTDVWLTDTMPALQQAVDITTSRGSCTAGAGWGGTAICDLGTLVPGAGARITLTAQVTTTTPAQLPWRMRNIVSVRAAETSNTAYADTMLHECHVRLNNNPTEYTTVQAAVDAVSPGDLVKVAGICVGANVRGGLRQQVYLNKSVTIRGGYTVSDWTASDPEANPTTLDALGQGRVLYITAHAPGAGISPTVEGLRITGGDASGQGGYSRGDDAGGGVYVVNAATTLRDNRIFNNTADSGGGLFLTYSDATLGGNTITKNTARGDWWPSGGGGLHLHDSNATLSDNTISDNTTASDGGGLYLYHSDATLSDNIISANTARSFGGGLCLYHSDATLTGNIISANTAHYNFGGGLFLEHSDVTLSGNTISSNTAACNHGGGLAQMWGTSTLNDNIISTNNAADGGGGGLYLYLSDTALTGNIISANTATGAGGLYLESSDVTLTGNTISGNTAVRDDGGGLYLYSPATLSGNTISGNIAEGDGGGVYGDGTFSGNTISGNTADRGGGLYLEPSDATLTGNIISANTAQRDGGGVYGYGTFSGNTISSNTADRGGGLYLCWGSSTLANNVVADNQANTAGSGLYIMRSSPRLLHTTIARNSGGDGSGIYVKEYTDWQGVTYYSTVALTNTILVSHTVGITVAAGITVTLEGTLWGSGAWANTADWGGGGMILTGTVNVRGDPAFVDPDARDYHITPDSAAVDAGVDAGVLDDIDGDPRPMGPGYDIGADELRASLVVAKLAHPNVVQAGAPLTYTIRITNTGDMDLHATITDTLPLSVTLDEASGGTLALPDGTLAPPDGTVVLPDGRVAVTWTAVITQPAGVWMGMLLVTVEGDYVGPLTNLVEVTTEEGATGDDSVTINVGWTVYLPLVLRNFP